MIVWFNNEMRMKIYLEIVEESEKEERKKR